VLSRSRSLVAGYLFEYASAAKSPARVSRLLLHLLDRFSVSKQIDGVFAFKRQNVVKERASTRSSIRRHVANINPRSNYNCRQKMAVRGCQKAFRTFPASVALLPPCQSNVRFGSKADIGLSPVDVRHSPKSGHLDVAAKGV
jgi:hypothetical protein